jgi:hypothetical protein
MLLDFEVFGSRYVDFQLCTLQILAPAVKCLACKVFIFFFINYLYYLRKRYIDARFLGGWVYPRARESNILPLTKTTIQSSFT